MTRSLHLPNPSPPSAASQLRELKVLTEKLGKEEARKRSTVNLDARPKPPSEPRKAGAASGRRSSTKTDGGAAAEAPAADSRSLGARLASSSSGSVGGSAAKVRVAPQQAATSRPRDRSGALSARPRGRGGVTTAGSARRPQTAPRVAP